MRDYHTYWYVDIEGTAYFAEAASPDAAVFSAMRRHPVAAFTVMDRGFRGYQGQIGFKRIIKPVGMSRAEFKRKVEDGTFELADLEVENQKYIERMNASGRQYDLNTRGLW